jgi:hypothetical protein
VLAEAFFGQGFFRTLLFLAIAFLWGYALMELFRSRSRGWVKAVWALVIICLPFVGAIVYLVVAQSADLEFDPMHEQTMSTRQQADFDREMTHRPI